jgi:hypothetical protein
MPLLHDPDIRADLLRRLAALRADSRPRWGSMSVDQMLWHVNTILAVALGEIEMAPQTPPLGIARRLLKYFVIYAPWGKGAPTLPAFIAAGEHDFDAERSRAVRLIEACAARPIDGRWPDNPMFGRVSGRDVSRLHAKHFAHHLRQFGV